MAPDEIRAPALGIQEEKFSAIQRFLAITIITAIYRYFLTESPI
jgi:hypothetical protein